MDMIPLKPERRAQLEEYAQRHSQDPAAALDEALAAYLEWERQDFEDAVEGIRRGHEDVRAGRTRRPSNFFPQCAGGMAFPVKVSAQAESDADSILQNFHSVPLS
jgi:predicted transcriptional regulator